MEERNVLLSKNRSIYVDINAHSLDIAS